MLRIMIGVSALRPGTFVLVVIHANRAPSSTATIVPPTAMMSEFRRVTYVVFDVHTPMNLSSDQPLSELPGRPSLTAPKKSMSTG